MRSFITACLLIIVSQIHSQTDKGDRILAWQIDMAENANYDSAFAYAKTACMESVHLFFPWSDLEPDTGNFDATFISSFLDVINLYYPANGTKVELQMATMNTVAKEVPSELAGVDFSDASMIRIFKRALDTVFEHIPDVKLAALNIGNESDIFMGTDASQYSAYKVFLDSVIPYAKQLYFNIHGDELKVGTTFTHAGITDDNRKNLCASVNLGLDIVSVTYYPLESNFTMKDPVVVSQDFDEIVSIYPDTNQPIYFVECGYSSSVVCNSSDSLQAEFYQQVFVAWDANQENIKYLTIFKSTDWSLQTVQDLGVYYGISDTVFLEYLRSLGVRTWPNNGNNKQAYYEILCQLEARNWCSSANCLWSGVENNAIENELNIYPNPNNGHFSIETRESNKEEIKVFDASGNKIPFESIQYEDHLEIKMNTPPGIYIIQYFDLKRFHTQRFIVK